MQSQCTQWVLFKKLTKNSHFTLKLSNSVSSLQVLWKEPTGYIVIALVGILWKTQNKCSNFVVNSLESELWKNPPISPTSFPLGTVVGTFKKYPPCHCKQRGYYSGSKFWVFWEFFINLLTQYPLGKFQIFQKLLTTLIKTYSQGNFRNLSKKALHLAQWVILSKNPKVLSWICLKFTHNMPNNLLNGFFESLLKNWTKLRVSFE